METTTRNNTTNTEELKMKISLIKDQIRFGRLKHQKVVTVAFPNSDRVSDEAIEQEIQKYLKYKPNFTSKQSIATVGSNSVSLWTIEI